MIRTLIITLAAGIGSYLGVQALGSQVSLSVPDGDMYLAQGATEVPENDTDLAQGDRVVPENDTDVAPSNAKKNNSTATISDTVTPTPAVISPTPWPTVPLDDSVLDSTSSDTDPSPTPVAPSPTPWPTPQGTPEPTATPAPSETPTPTPTPTPPMATTVVINEIAWSGSAVEKTGQYGEWFELFNAGSAPVDLTGWGLYERDVKKGDVLVIGLSGSIMSGGYFLVERVTPSSTDPIIDITADIYGSFGGSGFRNDPGEYLLLKNDSGSAIDQVGPGAWYAGSTAPEYASMERISPLDPGNDPDNWASNDGITFVGSSSVGPIRGTPKYPNSVSP